MPEYTSYLYSQEDFIKEYNGIPWKQIIGMHHRIVHGYDTINLYIVWNTSVNTIPPFKEYCSNIC